MLQILEDLQTGYITPREFRCCVSFQNCLDLNLAKYIQLPILDSAGVTSLDIERVDERYLLFGGKNGTVAIFDLEGTSNKFPYTSEIVANIRPSPDTAEFCIVKIQWYPFDTGLFTSSCKDKNVKIWDTNNLTPVDTIKLDSQIMGHDMSRIATQHNLIAIATTNPGILLYDAKCGLATHQLKGHEQGVEAVTWSTMAENLLASGGTDNRILLWDVRSAKGFLKCLDRHNLSGDKTFGIKSNLPTAHNKKVTSLKFTDNGLHLVSRSIDQEVLLWDVAEARNTLINFGIQLRKNCNFMDLPFTFDIFCEARPLLFVPSGNNIDIHDLHTGDKFYSLVGHYHPVNCCVYRSSYQELYSGSEDENVVAWVPGVGRGFGVEEKVGFQ